jgi:hypothetical protein
MSEGIPAALENVTVQSQNVWSAIPTVTSVRVLSNAPSAVLNADGSKTEMITGYHQDGSLKDKTVITTSADLSSEAAQICALLLQADHAEQKHVAPSEDGLRCVGSTPVIL